VACCAGSASEVFAMSTWNARSLRVMAGSRLMPMGLVLLAGGVLPACTIHGKPMGEVAVQQPASAVFTQADHAGTHPANHADQPGHGMEPTWSEHEAAQGRFDPATAFADEVVSQPMHGSEHLAQQTFATDGSDFDPFVSRDGKTLVFASTQHRPNPDLYIKAVGSRTMTQLTSDPASEVMPELSPDGARVAFASNRSGYWNLYVMPSSGGQAVQLTSGSSQDLHPTWSPDGKFIAFSRLGQASGRWELWVIEVARPQVAEYIGLGAFPRWSPVAGTGSEGRDKIVFQRSRERGDRAFSLWTIDYKPGSVGQPTEVVSARGMAAINPHWSPDGTMITYAMVPVRTGGSAFQRAEQGEVWVASIDGSSRACLARGPFMQSQPVWGGEGTSGGAGGVGGAGQIFFVSNRSGVDQVWSTSPAQALAAMGRVPSVAQGTSEHAQPVATVPTGGEPAAQP
jgi:TolB protein